MTISSIYRKLLRPFAVLLFWLLVWQLGAMAVAQELLFPTPAAVATAFLRLGCTTPFWQSVFASLLRTLTGLMAGGLLGILLAFATAWLPWARALLSPLLRMIRATPVVSFILLVLLMAQRTLVPAIIAGLMVLPVMWESVNQGLLSADHHLLELARAYRFSPWKTLRLIYLPCALPYLCSATITCLGLAWKSGVAAEVLCLPPLAIGTGLYRARLELETANLFAWTITIIILSLAFEWALSALFRRIQGRWSQ